MTGSTLETRLRPGRDVNDTSWIVQRYRRDWKAGRAQDVVFDPTREALTLRPLPRPEIAADWLPLAPVEGPDGTRYRSDPEADRILHKRACDADYQAVPGLDRRGFATGQLNTPTGLTIDARGRLYIADSGNSRVQIVDIATTEVIAVLTEGLVRPVQVAISDTGDVFVADPGTGRIHVFTSTFSPCDTLDLATRNPWDDTLWDAKKPAPRPLAITIMANGTLGVFDPYRPLLWHMTQSGVALQALPWPVAGQEPDGWAATPPRFAARGEMYLGPLDGSLHDMAWHRVLLDADTPDGTEISVQSFASNTHDASVINWAPRHPIAVPKARADRTGIELDRLVQSSTDLWSLSRFGPVKRAFPALHRFDGNGPNATDCFVLPPELARQIQVGDRIRLSRDDAPPLDYTVRAMADRQAEVLASGNKTVFRADDHVSLIARDGRPTNFAPPNLGPWISGVLPDVERSGTAKQLALPHLLASILAPGDTLSAAGGDGEARIEILDFADSEVEVMLDRPVEQDFSDATLSVLDTVGRLVVSQDLDDLGFLCPGNTLTVNSDARSETKEIAFVDGLTHTIWLTQPLSADITAANWTSAEVPQQSATDKGRYLWLRIVMSGQPAPRPIDNVGPPTHATNTPGIRALRISGPRPSLLGWLPAIYSDREPMFDAPGALFLERFLAAFEGQFTRMETAYESVSRLLNPQAADETWLNFLAAWMDFIFDPSWPIEARRQLVIEGADLQAASGTPRALTRYLEIYTRAPAAIAENYQNRPPPPMQLGARGALGIAPLGEPPGNDQFAHQFTVRVTLPGDREKDAALSAIHRIIESMKPAHTHYRVDTGDRRHARIGIDTSVGGIFIPGPKFIDPCLCGPGIPPGPRGQTGQVPDGFWLGGRLGRGPVAEFSHQGDPQ